MGLHDTGQELRALQVFDEIPEGCILHTQRSGAHLPHLRPDELAVVDLSDTEPAHGELFLIRWMSGDHSVMQTNRRWHENLCDWQGNRRPGQYAWWLSPLNRPRSREESDRWMAERRPVHLSDGPIRIEGLRSKIVGRVIGIFEPAAVAV